MVWRSARQCSQVEIFVMIVVVLKSFVRHKISQKVSWCWKPLFIIAYTRYGHFDVITTVITFKNTEIFKVWERDGTIYLLSRLYKKKWRTKTITGIPRTSINRIIVMHTARSLFFIISTPIFLCDRLNKCPVIFLIDFIATWHKGAKRPNMSSGL